MEMMLRNAFERSVCFPALIKWRYSDDTYHCSERAYVELVSQVNQAYGLFKALHRAQRYDDVVELAKQVILFEKRERVAFEIEMDGVYDFLRCADEEQSYAHGRTQSAFYGWLTRAKKVRFALPKELKRMRMQYKAMKEGEVGK